MRPFTALLVGMVPLIALQGQPVLPATPPVTGWKCPAGCEQRLREDYHPLTRTERGSLYFHSLLGAHALVFTALRSGINQGLNAPEEWGGGAQGYGYRLGSAFGQDVVGNTIEAGTAVALDEDNRYFASGEHGVWRRLKYAVASSFLARHDNGSRSISISALVGPAAGAAISRLWQPASTNSAGDAAESFGVSIGATVGVNVAREFLPGFFRKFLP